MPRVSEISQTTANRGRARLEAGGSDDKARVHEQHMVLQGQVQGRFKVRWRFLLVSRVPASRS